MTEERFKEIEDKLVSYLGENPPHPNMRVFCGLSRYSNHNEVKEVLMKSTKITLSDAARQELARTFVKVILPKAQPVQIESWRTTSKKRKKRLRQEFHAFDGTVREFCENQKITQEYLRSIADPEDWKLKYEYKERIDWDALMDAFEYCTQSVQEFCEENGLDIATFRAHCPPELWKERYAYVRKPEQTDWKALVNVLETMPTKSIQDFCKEQGLDPNVFRLHCPKEVWKAHYRYAKLVVDDWNAKIEEMKASGLSHQEWCNRQGISAVVFKAHCPSEVLVEYDKTNMEDRKRAKAFRPELSIKENAKLMGLTPQNMYVWTTSKLQKVAPEKWERMQQLKAEAKLDDKDRKIIELETSIGNLEKLVADLNEKNAKLTSKNDQLQSGLTSLKIQLGNEKRKNQDLAKKIKAFADTLLAE